jgi:uncharacterized protein YjbJ (UPF0337 family)
MAGTWDKLKGKAKEVAGAATGDKGTENKGKLEQAKGSVKNAGQNLKERAKEKLGRAADEAKDVAERVERDTKPDPDRDRA